MNTPSAGSLSNEVNSPNLSGQNHDKRLALSKKLRLIGWVLFVSGFISLISLTIIEVLWVREVAKLSNLFFVARILSNLSIIASFALFIVASFVQPVAEFHNLKFWFKRLIFDCILAFVILPLVLMIPLLPFSIFELKEVHTPEIGNTFAFELKNDSPWVMFLLLLITQVSMGAVFFLRSRKLPIKTLTASVKNWKKDLKIALLCTLAMLGISIVYSVVLTAFKVEVPPQFVISEDTRKQFWIFMIMGAIGAPLVEELFFRGYLFSVLKERNVWLGLLGSSFAFALVHQHVIYFPVLFGFGFILAWSYWRTKNILVPMTMHALNNLFAFTLLYFSN